jgi:hypothetical protein
MEELVAYDPHLVVGVLGGAAGTTLDAFQLLHETRKYGGRAALFGRKINQSECQLAFIEFLRHIADGVIEPAEAVRAYHAVLAKLNIRPQRSLEDDLTFQTSVMSYAGDGKTISLPPASKTSKPRSNGARSNGQANTAPDFARMTSQERSAYHRERLNRMFG